MFDQINSPYISSEMQNAPNLAFAANPILGNVTFNIQAPQAKGTKVQPGFPVLPYVSLEALIFFQGMSNPQTAPYTTLSGTNTGQQVIGGQITQQDDTGTSRYSQGYSSSLA